MIEKPPSLVCKPEELHKVSIDSYLIRVYDAIMDKHKLERGNAMNPHFELVDRMLTIEKPGGVIVTDGGMRYLTYEDKIVAAVIQTRSEFNYMRIDYYLNLPSVEDPNLNNDEYGQLR